MLLVLTFSASPPRTGREGGRERRGREGGRGGRAGETGGGGRGGRAGERGGGGRAGETGGGGRGGRAGEPGGGGRGGRAGETGGGGREGGREGREIGRVRRGREGGREGGREKGEGGRAREGRERGREGGREREREVDETWHYIMFTRALSTSAAGLISGHFEKFGLIQEEHEVDVWSCRILGNRKMLINKVISLSLSVVFRERERCGQEGNQEG